MKLKRILLAIFCLATVFALVGCDKGTTEIDGTKVIFELEGGTFKNSPYAVTYVYQLEEEEETFVYSPEMFDSKKPVVREGYELVGWFKTKTGEGETATYSEQFDFAVDKVGYEGITLYAKWKKLINFRYTVGYMDGETFVGINSYSDVESSPKFEDYLNYAEKRSGYTSVKSYNEKTKKWVADYYDIDGNPWDANFKHPLDEENPEVKVVVKYVKGTGIEFVRNKKELIDAKNKGIFLLNDIDMEGETLEFGKNGEYKDKYFYGNGHSISNFKLSYKLDSLYANFIENDGEEDSLYVSLFGYLNKSYIKDVTFENFTVEIGTEDEYGAHNKFIKNVYYAPIAVSAVKSTVENVKLKDVSVTYKQSNFYENFDMEALFIETANPYYSKDGETSFTNCEINVTVTEQDEN